MNEQKTIMALAKLYKGVMIFQTTTGFAVFNEDKEHIPFNTQREAECFVDGLEAGMLRIYLVGFPPVQ